MKKTTNSAITTTEARNSLASLIKATEALQAVCNRELYEGKLPETVLTFEKNQGRRMFLGYFEPAPQWNIKGSNEKLHQITIATDGLNRSSREILATLLHELVHLYCCINGIADTSRGGLYHNEKYKEFAEAHGLIVKPHADAKQQKKHGNNRTALNELAVQSIIDSAEFAAFEAALTLYHDEPKEVAKTKKAKDYYVHTCIKCGQVTFNCKHEVRAQCPLCGAWMAAEHKTTSSQSDSEPIAAQSK